MNTGVRRRHGLTDSNGALLDKNGRSDDELTYEATLSILRRSDVFELWQPAVTVQPEFQGFPDRMVFVRREFKEILENLDGDINRPLEAIKAEKKGELSSLARVERFLDAFAAGADKVRLVDFGMAQRPPIKRLNRSGLYKYAIWEMRLQQYRMFGWWICERVFVVFSGDWTGPVHEAGEKGTREPPSPEWHGDQIISWRTANGLDFFWKGKDNDVQ